MVTEGIEPSTVALLAQRSNQLSYATFLIFPPILAQYYSSLKEAGNNVINIKWGVSEV